MEGQTTLHKEAQVGMVAFTCPFGAQVMQRTYTFYALVIRKFMFDKEALLCSFEGWNICEGYPRPFYHINSNNNNSH